MFDGKRINTLEAYEAHFTEDPNKPFHFVENLSQRIASDSIKVERGEWTDEERWNNVFGNSLAGTLRLIGKGWAGIELLTTIVSTIEEEFIRQGIEGFGGVEGLMKRDPYARVSIEQAFSKSNQNLPLPSSSES